MIFPVCAKLPLRPPHGSETPQLGNILDHRDNLYYKILREGDVVYNPYTKDSDQVIECRSHDAKVNVYVGWMTHPCLTEGIALISSDFLIEELWTFFDFVNHITICAYISPFSYELSHPLFIELYIHSKRFKSIKKQSNQKRIK